MAETRVLADPDFRRLLLAEVFSVVGSSMVPVALSFALAGRGSGAGAIGAVLFAETVPLALLLLVGGIVSDRWSPRPVMVSADAGRFLVQSVLAVLFALGHAPLPAVIALSAMLGIGNAFAMPGRAALLVRVVPEDRRQSANAILTSACSGASMLAPVLGGVLVAAVGAQAAIGVDALSYLLSGLLLSQLRLCRAAPDSAVVTEGLGASLRLGWQEFTRRRWIWLLAAQLSLVLFLSWGPFIVLGALLFAHHPNGAVLWGGLMSALGGGVTLGAAWAARWRPGRPILVCLLGFLLYPLMPASVAAELPFAAEAAAAFVTGIGFGLYTVLWETTLQREIAPEALSRVSSFDQFGSLCMLPLGYVLAGPLGAALGTGGALFAGAAVTASCIVGCLCLADIRDAARRAPD